MWRWDQGRLQYFQYETLKRIARVFFEFDGADITKEVEPLFRQALIKATGLPFAPSTYTVKRNYGRVFQCALLGSFYREKLVATDICKAIAAPGDDSLTADEYLMLFSSRFSYPFPAFQGYTVNATRVFPLLSIVKLLIARQLRGYEASLTVEDVFFFLIGTNSTGEERIEHYLNLSPTIIDMPDNQVRQIRELLIFASQFSFLNYYNSILFLDELADSAIELLLKSALIPTPIVLTGDKFKDLLLMGGLDSNFAVPELTVSAPSLDDIEFIEGKRTRREHIKIERSPLLRQYYICEHERPICDACLTDMQEKYPWTDFLLETHHLLPLSSAVKITNAGTSLDDVVGLCPSCHRAIHSFYRYWLGKEGMNDFSSKDEAVEVYSLAKRAIR